MAQPQRATIAFDLRERLNAFISHGSRYLDEESFQFKTWLRDAEKLSSADALDASLIRADMYTLAGNVQQALYWSQNARSLGGGLRADGCSMSTLGNLGFFSRAAPYYDACAEDPSFMQAYWLQGMLLARFEKLLEVGARARAQGFKDPEMARALHTAAEATDVLQRLNVSEEQVRAVLDLAGEVMREHKLIWSGDEPLIRVLGGEDAAVLYQLQVPVTNDEAFDLTDEVLELMSERHLDYPGLLFSFLASEH